jgi:tetratricopeptide (TPR) repeat protein
LESTWRERGYNSPYLLASAPDYISFSTGVKPSAPAERALLLYQQFQDCYRAVSFNYDPPAELGDPVIFPVFKKRRQPVGPFEPDYTAGFVNLYNAGINASSSGNYKQAELEFERALRLAGKRPYLYVLYMMSQNYFQMGQYELGNRMRNELVARDSMMYEPQADLYLYDYVTGNRPKAAIHRSWLEALVPWRVRQYDSLAQVHAARWQAEQKNKANQPKQ